MNKYRKKTCIEVIGEEFEKGYWVQNEGDDSDRWIIPYKTFFETYEEADDE